MKYLVTDPCYVVPNEEWSDFLDETRYHSADGVFTYHWPFAKMPRDIEPEVRMISVSDIPDGDIGFSWYGQQFGADAGSVCICEIPDDYLLPDHGFGVIVNTLSDAEKVMNYARSFDYELRMRLEQDSEEYEMF